MQYLYLKSLHLIFVVTWFAGLFYVPRLFIYIIEAQEKSPKEREILTPQLLLMAKRLWFIITMPSAILTLIFGLSLLILSPQLIHQDWMVIKLGFVVLLYCYHFKCHFILKNFKNNKIKHTSNYMRIWNEVPTILLFCIVFLVVLKDGFNWIYGLIGIFLLLFILMAAIKIYKKRRQKK